LTGLYWLRDTASLNLIFFVMQISTRLEFKKTAFFCNLLAGCLLIAVSTAQTHSATESKIIRIGSIDLGMRIPEIKAALPGAVWKLVSKSAFSGRESKVSAEGAIELGGRRFNVEIRDELYEWDIELTAHSSETSPSACEQAGLAVLTALEDGTGPLTASRDDGETVSFGRASTARFRAFEGRREPVARKHLERSTAHTLVLSARLEAQRQEVKATVSFDATQSKNCRINLIALGWQQQPPWQSVAFDERKVIKRMSIGDQHRLASGVALPENGAAVTMQCQVSRQSGRVLVCNELGDKPFSAAISNLAGRYAGAMAFDTADLDRDNPQPVLIDIPIRVSPSDVKSLGFGNRAPLLMSELTFVASPPTKEVQYAYPVKALRKGVGAQVAIICQVQVDGSLICRPPVVTQTDGQTDLHPDFAHGAAKLIPQYRVAPQLKNGESSNSVVFGLGLRFALSE
jgi:hypothetical protein